MNKFTEIFAALDSAHTTPHIVDGNPDILGVGFETPAAVISIVFTRPAYDFRFLVSIEQPGETPVRAGGAFDPHAAMLAVSWILNPLGIEHTPVFESWQDARTAIYALAHAIPDGVLDVPDFDLDAMLAEVISPIVGTDTYTVVDKETFIDLVYQHVECSYA